MYAPIAMYIAEPAVKRSCSHQVLTQASQVGYLTWTTATTKMLADAACILASLQNAST
jgi:hypothetical protein